MGSSFFSFFALFIGAMTDLEHYVGDNTMTCLSTTHVVIITLLEVNSGTESSASEFEEIDLILVLSINHSVHCSYLPCFGRTGKERQGRASTFTLDKGEVLVTERDAR